MLRKLMITVPLVLQVGKNRMTLSMNKYERQHFYVLSNIKKAFQDMVAKRLMISNPSGYITPIKRFRVGYKIWFPDRRRRDCSNYIGMIDKLLMDALQKQGRISDDSWECYIGSEWEFAGIDTGRVEVTIWEV